MSRPDLSRRENAPPDASTASALSAQIFADEFGTICLFLVSARTALPHLESLCA
jgi:hypothetical protein